MANSILGKQAIQSQSGRHSSFSAPRSPKAASAPYGQGRTASDEFKPWAPPAKRDSDENVQSEAEPEAPAVSSNSQAIKSSVATGKL